MVGDALEYAPQIGFRVDAVELGRADRLGDRLGRKVVV